MYKHRKKHKRLVFLISKIEHIIYLLKKVLHFEKFGILEVLVQIAVEKSRKKDFFKATPNIDKLLYIYIQQLLTHKNIQSKWLSIGIVGNGVLEI